ncbi:hypothetical protein D3C76_1116170 [compost metagenome]
MQQLAAALQVFAAGQFEGDGCQARQCGDAHQQQHQASIFVFDLGDALHVRGFGAHREPEHKNQVAPDPGVPADEDFFDERIGRHHDAHRDTEQDGGGQARVGAGQKGHGGSMGWALQTH